MKNEDLETFSVRYRELQFEFPTPVDSDFIATIMKKKGAFYEKKFLDALMSKVSQEGIVLDCGANIGNHTVFFAGVMGMKTYAFEPILRNQILLKNAVNLNALNDKVIVVPKALSDKERVVALTCEFAGNPGMFKIIRSGQGEVAEATTIDIFLSDHNVSEPVNLIKIDVGGHEQETIKGALKTVEKYKPVVTAEFTDAGSYLKFLKVLEPFGYVANDIYNATPTVVFGSALKFENNENRILEQIKIYEKRHFRIEKIVAHMATYPPREAMLRQSLLTIAPQVDLVRVCLNEYEKMPEFLSEMENVEAFLPDDDWKDVGKFITKPSSDDLVFFVDDDLLYHKNFVRRMVRIGRKVGLDNNVFGIHGANYRAGILAPKLDRKVYHFKRRLNETTQVEQLGTGTMMALGKNVAPRDFMLGSERFVDVRYARWLFENGVTSWAISRPHGFVKEIEPEDDYHETIWKTYTKNTPEHVMDEIRAFSKKHISVDSTIQN